MGTRERPCQTWENRGRKEEKITKRRGGGKWAQQVNYFGLKKLGTMRGVLGALNRF